MSEQTVREKHEQYTNDTREVATFLKNEGKSLGCPSAWLVPGGGNGVRPGYILHLPNHARIAKYLANQSTFSVPVSIMEALNNAIKLRNETKLIYQKRRAGKTEEDEKHDHVIQLFEEVRDHLLTKLEARPAGT